MIDELNLAADLTRRAIETLDRAGGDADLAAALLDHGLKMIEVLIVHAEGADNAGAAAG